jgi:hypothetical protein
MNISQEELEGLEKFKDYSLDLEEKNRRARLLFDIYQKVLSETDLEPKDLIG